MLDLDAIFVAADLIDGKQGNTQDPYGKQPCFPVKTAQPCGLQGGFLAWETRETVFEGGAGLAPEHHLNFAHDDSRSPLPPNLCSCRAEHATSHNTVSHVSHVRDSQYPCGFSGDFCGKHSRFPLFPVFPVVPDQAEAQQERAAIMEFDGGMSRAEAEAAAGLVSRVLPGLLNRG